MTEPNIAEGRLGDHHRRHPEIYRSAIERAERGAFDCEALSTAEERLERARVLAVWAQGFEAELRFRALLRSRNPRLGGSTPFRPGRHHFRIARLARLALRGAP